MKYIKTLPYPIPNEIRVNMYPSYVGACKHLSRDIAFDNCGKDRKVKQVLYQKVTQFCETCGTGCDWLTKVGDNLICEECKEVLENETRKES